MDIYSFAPIAGALDLAYFAVTALAGLLTPLAGNLGTALAIVTVTLLVRAALIPVGVAQVRAEFVRRRLAPQLQQIQRRYQGNPELLRRKTMELYASEQASPFGGCLPTLAQAPILSLVYGLFIVPTINGHANTLLTEQLAGIPLGSSFVVVLGAGEFWPGLVVFGSLLAIIGTVTWMSRRLSLRYAPPQPDSTSIRAPASMPALAGVLSWLPFLTVVFAAIVPLAATLYLTISTTWTLVERATIRRRFEAGASRPTPGV